MKAILLSAVVASGIYGTLFIPSLGGFGYAGHGGWHRGPSFFYWGGPSTYHSPSVRTGSRSGPGVRGGGPNAGK